MSQLYVISFEFLVRHGRSAGKEGREGERPFILGEMICGA